MTYSKVSDQSAAADRDSLLLDWGDGMQELVLRSNGPDLDFNGIPDGVIIGDDVKLNQYTAVHTYPKGFPPMLYPCSIKTELTI